MTVTLTLINSPQFTLAHVDTFSPEKREMVPPLADRMKLEEGDIARLFVLKDGAEHVYPWVDVVERTPTGYVGMVGGVCNSEDWLEYSTRVVFTADNIIEL